MTKAFGVNFKEGGKIYDFSYDLETLGDLQMGDAVIVETVQGLEYGKVAAERHEVYEQALSSPLRAIRRRATPQDEEQVKRNRQKEKEAYQYCLSCVERRNIDMNLVSVECNFEATKLLFYFTHEGRLDFRELVKDLAGRFHTRIELRQIKERDEAKMIGGLGVCGRALCCSCCMKDFATVTMKMAKDQGLFLNPTKISGACGKLMCCLKYEEDVYKELLQIVPGVGAVVETKDGTGTVIASDLLHGKIKVKYDDMEMGTPKDVDAKTARVIKPGKTGRKQEFYTPEQPPEEPDEAAEEESEE